jgi:hypothetical protein
MFFSGGVEDVPCMSNDIRKPLSQTEAAENTHTHREREELRLDFISYKNFHELETLILAIGI